ncbi:MAG TPA: hypothetical protein VF998_04640, partial [Candidatus Limnocylindria bacterium]
LEETAVLVYRVIKGDRARREDFLSDEASGKRPRDLTPEKLRRHKGFSIWRVEAKARRIAQRFQRLGTHIAEVRLPAGATLEPFPDEPDHQTIYGDPDAFVERVERVVPV